MKRPYVSIRDLNVWFGNIKKLHNAFHVIENLNLEIEKGEIVSILGPSGCGKTTLLKAISGVLSWETKQLRLEGRIQVGEKELRSDAQNVSNVKPSLQKTPIGFIFQTPALLEWKTVIENVRLPGKILHDLNMVSSSEYYSNLVGLADFNGAYPMELSGGMKARVAIARALVSQPELLLMDESFSSLDEITREEMHEELIRIWMTVRPTILFVTHSIPEAIFLSNRVAVMTNIPSRIAREFTIDFKYPRDRRLKESSDFLDRVKEIRLCLEESKRI